MAAIPTPVEVCLTESEKRSIRGLITEKKALFVAGKYLRCKYGRDVVIEQAHNGADLGVSFGGQKEIIEVKGTTNFGIAWSQLKVSSRKSFQVLKSGTARLYRVVDLDSAKPRIYILEYGTHYDLISERRWAVKATSRAAKRYPLRGAPYRYDLPYDAVAEHVWGGVGK